MAGTSSPTYLLSPCPPPSYSTAQRSNNHPSAHGSRQHVAAGPVLSLEQLLYVAFLLPAHRGVRAATAVAYLRQGQGQGQRQGGGRGGGRSAGRIWEST